MASFPNGEAGTAVAAVEAQAQAEAPSCSGVRRQRTGAWSLPTAGKVMCLPRRELEHTGHQYHHPAAIGTAPASARYRVSTAANAIPAG